MSGDPIWIANDGTSLIQIAILAIGLTRVAEMRKGFVDPTYRSRALWSGLMMIFVVVANAVGLVPTPTGTVAVLLYTVPLYALVGVGFAFEDRTALVAMKTDFFHRDILGWRQIRVPAGLVLPASLGIGVVVGVTPQAALASPPSWVIVGTLQVAVVAPVLLGLGSIVMVIGSRRTPDQTLRRSIRLLGVGFGFFVVGLVAFIAAYSDLGALIGDVATAFATYFLYLSAMSLTLLGKTERDDTS
jgi:hypothetical protein